MSHFSVAVITKQDPEESCIIEDLLERYNENKSVPYYIYETQEQFLKKERERLEEFKNTTYAKYLENPKEYVEGCSNESHIKYVENFMSYYNVKDEELISQRNKDYLLKENADLEEGEEYIDEDGNLYSTYNPDSKWDWYSIGGRWSGLLNLKSGERSDCAQIKDVDFGFDIDFEKEKKNKDVVETYEKLITKGDGFHKAEYLKEIYPTIESYIRSEKQFVTYAVIDIDGNWNEKGQMYWFGVTGATPKEEISWNENYQNIIKSFDPECWITIVDCHI